MRCYFAGQRARRIHAHYTTPLSPAIIPPVMLLVAATTGDRDFGRLGAALPSFIEDLFLAAIVRLSTRPRWAARNFWAPEIQEDRGRFFVYYTARKRGGPLCVAVATATRPAGPYTDHGPLVCQEVGSIDAFFVRDENNRPYLIWKEDGNDRNQPTPIWAQRLAESGTRLIGRRTEILRNDAPWEKHVVEGTFIVRRGGWFYHFYSGNACCGRECNYALGVARARKLLGPWEKNPQNPILAANENWRCPGHGSIVSTPDGRDFSLSLLPTARRHL